MKLSKERAIRVIKRLRIEPAQKVRTLVKPVIVKDSGSTASVVSNWILERQKNRLAEAVISNSKILGWKSS